MPEELWAEICDIIQEAGIKTISKKNKYKKAKWLSEEALQIAEKRTDAKVKEEKEKYTPFWMQGSKEQQGEIKLSAVINVKKNRGKQ